MVRNIHIRINKSRFYIYNRVSNPVALKVTDYEPYDLLSKKFNKYTHVIQYPSEKEYNPSDYVLCLDDPNARFYYYILYLYGPTKKIVSVDIFFLSNDKDRINPLIFGFNYEKDPSVYYTYYYVRWVKYFYGSMGSRGSFGKEDLISRLMDERGIYESDSYHKFVIRLSYKPNETTTIQYPKGGNNSGMITLKKSDVQDHPNYVSYEHFISPKSNVESFYVSFHQDSLYMIGGSTFGKLKSVAVYYNKHDGEYPVVVVFRFPSRTKLYKFSTYNTDFSNTSKRIADLIDFSSNDLNDTLIKQYKLVNKEITFHKQPGTNKFISVLGHKFNVGHKDEFRRIILKPNTDIYNNGSSNGPWDVYKNKLTSYRSNKIIDDKSLDALNDNKFSSIYVYFAANNDPLLVGFIGESANKFFKIGKGGKLWVKDDDTINIYSDNYLIPKLRQLEKDKNEQDVVKPGEAGKPSHRPGPAPPPRPTARTPTALPAPKHVKSITLKIDLSNESGSNYDNGNVTVSRKSIFDKCNLFCFFTHALKNKSEFSISSISNGSSSTTSIDHIKMLIVKSVSVYFNINELKKPVLLECVQTDGQKKYFSNIIQNKTSSSFSSISEIRESNLVDQLIKESDRINDRLTFQIDRTSKYNDINVVTKSESKYGFSTYTHSTTDSKNKKSNILYNNKFLIGSSNNKHETLQEIQNKNYKEIKTYFLNSNKKFALIIELNESSKVTYVCRKDERGLYWNKETFTDTNDTATKNKLDEIFYLSTKSIIIEVDKRVLSDHSNSYEMKLIDNRSKKDSVFPEVTKFSMSKLMTPLKKILVVNENIRCKSSSYHSFTCYSHIVVDSGGASEIDEISGLRLYLPKVTGTDDNMNEIELFKEKSNSKNRMFLYYTPDLNFQDIKNRVYVYFYLYDPRPLLVSYTDYFFRRINENDSQWYHDSSIKSREDCSLLTALNDIYKSMKKKLIFVKDGHLGSVHPSRDFNFGKFRKYSYTPYLLREDEHFYTLTKETLIGETTSETIIDKLLDKLDRSPFDKVNVYTNQTDPSLKDMILIEFINESKKIHFKRKDEKGDFWVEELVSYNNDDDLKRELENIQKTINVSVVYQLDRKYFDTSNINFSRQSVVSGSEFTKYSHTPSGGTTNSYLIYYNNEKLFKKDGHQYLNLSEVENLQLSNLTVYFGSKVSKGNSDCPLILELKVNRSSTFYLHKRDHKKHFWEKFSFSSRFNTNELIYKLDETQFNLADSIVLLLDRNNYAYGDEEVKKAVENLQTPKVIHLPRLDSQNIKLNRSRQSVSCVAKYGFKMSDHFIGSIGGRDNCSLRFFIPAGANYDKYNELILYDSKGIVKEYLYYETHYDNVHIFFYGDDPRPLLFCYGGSVYRPIKFEDYFVKWCRDDSINNCNCQRGRDNSNLVETLADVVAILNVVKLNIKPETSNPSEKAKQRGSKVVEYEVQNYAGNHIKVRVSYENGSCYRLYKHEPIGISEFGPDFRFGKLTYEGMTNAQFIYDYRKRLKVVAVYYSLFDVEHKYPLLVSLRYGDNSFDYFELVNFPNFSWRFIEDNVYESDAESKAYEIMENLKIKFDRKKDSPTLFDPDECKEGSNTVMVIGGSVGGVVGTAAVGGGVTVAVRPELIITSIRALV